MGDHRASVKIEMEFHGVREKCNMEWINYCPEDGVSAPDKRVREFFEDVYEQGMEKYNRRTEKREEKEFKEREKAELARLKKKYEKS